MCNQCENNKVVCKCNCNNIDTVIKVIKQELTVFFVCVDCKHFFVRERIL